MEPKLSMECIYYFFFGPEGDIVKVVFYNRFTLFTCLLILILILISNNLT
jgi:hypothetical protein